MCPQNAYLKLRNSLNLNIYVIVGATHVCKIVMYVRVEVNDERQFVKIEEIDHLTFHAFVKKGK